MQPLAFPVVGVGASAGGLEAFGLFLKHLPPNSGMAFVLVQHLDPTHESMSREILSKVTAMPVAEAQDGVRVEPNHVYLIPPNRSLAFEQGALKLSERSEGPGMHMSIDFFFHSLAHSQKEKAIGIVLSGTASDGTLGLKAIRAEGGVTLAQDPKSAKFDGMPRSAIASGAVDLVLEPEKMGSELARIVAHSYFSPGAPDTDRLQVPGDAHARILNLLRSACRVDFSSYKPTTVNRRIARRLVLKRIETLDAYATYLETHEDEVKALYADILIHVTGFFRDPEAHDVLKSKILPQLLKNHAADAPVRIWVPGCSTGEEAYSIAIAVTEFLDDLGSHAPIQIFATDVSEQALQKARVGFYPESISRHVSENRLRRFFTHVDGGYKIIKSVRDCCLFSRHDVTRDPPFGKVHLISCRNLLIYFSPALQRQVMPVFHYALLPGGCLWVGRSENCLSRLFSQRDKTQKFFFKLNTPSKLTFQASSPFPHPVVPAFAAKGQSAESPRRFDAEKEADRITQAEYVPSGVVIDENLEVIQFRGRTSPYLEPAAGKAGHDLMRMAHSELQSHLGMAIQTARMSGAPVVKNDLVIRENGVAREFNLRVIPIRPRFARESAKEIYFLILFEEVKLGAVERDAVPSRAQARRKSKRADEGRLAKQNQELSAELEASKEYQRVLIEDHRTAQEEVTAAIEELQSANEELQSSNEEVETAKEELQSTNEELVTVNEESQNRNTELNLLNNDMMNLVGSVDITIVMVKRDGSISRYTPQAEKTLGLISADIGRPISVIRPGINVPNLSAAVAKVIESGGIEEKEVQSVAGKWFRLQVKPYRTLENTIDGAVISLVDIDHLKKSAEEMKRTLDYRTSVANTVQLPLAVLDMQLHLSSMNDAFYRCFSASAEDIGKDLFTVMGETHGDLRGLRASLTEVLSHNIQITNLKYSHAFRAESVRHLLLNARKILWIGSESPSLLLSIEDVTERELMKSALEISENKFKNLVQLAPVGIFHLDAEGRCVFVSEHLSQMVGRTPDKLLGTGWRGVVHPADRERVYTQWAKAQKVHTEFTSEHRYLRDDGKVIWVNVHAQPIFDHTDQFMGYMGVSQDITERKEADERIGQFLLREQQTNIDLKKTNSEKDVFLAVLSHELRTPLTVILMWAQMLSRGKADAEKIAQGVKIIEQSAHTQQQLIEDLLDVSRIIMGKLALSLREVDLISVTQAAVESVRPLAHGKSVRIETRIDSRGSVVSADPARLQQVIWNLLTNAIKFSEEGGLVSVVVDQVEGHARIRVRDTGKGMSAEFLPKIFNRFSQADSTSTRVHGGLGLGLAIVRNLVGLQGGTVSADSPGEGKGATFTVILPLITPSAIPSVTPSTHPAAAEYVRLDGLRVLVVDDDQPTREALTTMLGTLGVEAKAVGSAGKALEVLPEFRPDVLLSDVAMPDEDGYSLIGRIRKLRPDQGGDTPAIAVTAYAGPGDLTRAIAAGFQIHLAKPIDWPTLTNSIAKLSARKRSS